MNKTPIVFSVFGAALNLHLTGEPADLARTVNLYYNHGIAANVPDTFREGEDNSVLIQTTKDRLLAGLAGIVRNEWESTPGVTKAFKGKPGSEFLAAAQSQAEHIFRTEFERERACINEAESTINHIPDLPFTDDELPRAVMREKWAKFHREFVAMRHNSATKVGESGRANIDLTIKASPSHYQFSQTLG